MEVCGHVIFLNDAAHNISPGTAGYSNLTETFASVDILPTFQHSNTGFAEEHLKNISFTEAGTCTSSLVVCRLFSIIVNELSARHRNTACK
jgi:hypothetical protein